MTSSTTQQLLQLATDGLFSGPTANLIGGLGASAAAVYVTCVFVQFLKSESEARTRATQEFRVVITEIERSHRDQLEEVMRRAEAGLARVLASIEANRLELTRLAERGVPCDSVSAK